MADSADLDAFQALTAGADTSVLIPKGAQGANFVAALQAVLEDLDGRVYALENP